MSQFFGPTPVSVRDIPDWLHEAWRLFVRRPLGFLVLSVVFHLLAYCSLVLRPFSLLFILLLGNIFLSVAIVATEAADRSRSVPIIPTYRMIKNIILVEALLALAFLVLFVLSHFVVSTITAALPPTEPTAIPLPAMIRWLWPGFIGLAALCIGVVYIWFVPPLISLNEMELRTALRMSRLADDMSGWAIYAGSVIPILTFVAVVMLLKPLVVLSVLFAPLFATYQYVVYRHVFTGRRRNHEVVTATPVVVNTASQVAPNPSFKREAVNGAVSPSPVSGPRPLTQR